MSTRKVRDGTSKALPPSVTTKPKKSTETKKKETPKSKTSSRIHNKKTEDDEEKVKKHTIKPVLGQSSNRRVSKPAPAKKLASTAKPPPSRPVTPPSSRVTKSQFFPSKKMYSNALTRDGRKKPSTTNTSVRSEVLVPKIDDVSPETSSMSDDRPRTATLRKGSIVNKNIVGPDAPKTKVSLPVKVQQPTVPPKIKAPLTANVEEPPIEYEDDFDSYESDFDEYDSSGSSTILSSGSTSTESTETESTEPKSAPKRVSSAGTDDEKKLDSGNYELPESRHRQILDNIKESIEKENANLNHQHNRSNLGSLSDEGFEDGKSLQFINFLGAQKKYQHRKSVELRRKRGEEILSMIRLDQYNFTLYDLAPVPYDVFIKNYGKSNSVQASVQTGEDDVNEEVQTDEICFNNKWTQCPPCFSQPEENEDFWEAYKSNYLGVGGDNVNKEKHVNAFNENNLEKFLVKAGNLILNLQAEADVQVNARSDKSNIPFSKSCIVCNTHTQDVVRDRPLNDVCFSPSNANQILTVHGRKNEDVVEKSVVCVWNISNVEVPEMLLFAFGDVTCCATNLECPNLIFGGLNNGSLVVWDTKENSKYHKNVSGSDYNDEYIVSRSPTYTTEIDCGHCHRIVSIQPLPNTSIEKNLFSSLVTTQVCSLDTDGVIVVWSVIFKEKNHGKVVESQGLAHWGSVILTMNIKISLRQLYPEIDDFNCTDLGISHLNSNNLYISTSYGVIIHCLSNGGKTSVKKFLPETQSQANCLEMCPFSFEYFLVGFDNGNISFYSHVTEKPLMVLSNKDVLEGKCQIRKIQWSHNRPFIFYTKDDTNTLHVWNLKVSDMFPIYSVPFKDNIVSMKLSPVITTSSDSAHEESYMMIATENGSVYIHLLNEENDQQSVEEFDKDKRIFFNYINRCI